MKKMPYFVIVLLLALTACEKQVPQPEQQPAVTYSRTGVTPVTLTAGQETRTVLEEGNTVHWNAGDMITLLRDGDNSLQLLDATAVRAMTKGEKKSILLVNPSSSGSFLGYDGTARVRNSTGLSGLSHGSGISSETAASNLEAITALAENLRNDTDYIFTLEKVDGGWLLYHKASGTGVTAVLGAGEKDDNTVVRYVCSWGTPLGVFDVVDGSGNARSTNTVYGRPEQVYVVNTVEGQDYYLWSGGNGSDNLCWHTTVNGWMNWLFYEVPDTSAPFTADADGATSTFTNTTGFSAGTDTWYAVYPSSSAPSLSNGTLTFTLPRTQVYEADSFGSGANVAAGILSGDRVTFRSLCGLLKLSLKGTQRVLSLSVTDKAGTALWGTGTVDMTSGDWSAAVSGGSATVTLDCGTGVVLDGSTATDFYLVVPAGAFKEGFDVEVVTSFGTASKSTSKDNTIARADIKSMPAFTLGTLSVTETGIENEVVAAYMGKGTYSSFGETSHFNDSDVKALADACSWSADQPVGWTISLEGITSPTITVMKDGSSWYTEENLSGDSYTITNLTPGCTYTYTVTKDGTTLTEGAFKATGQVRMVCITDAWNYRDLGGWTGLGGATIRYGKLFRGGSLNGLYVSGGNELSASYRFRAQDDIDRLGIKAELDLRGDRTVVGEWGNQTDAHAVSLGTTQLKDADFIRIMSDYGLYYPLGRASIIQDVAWIIRELQDGKPVAFHCRSGADRTGAVSLLIEGLLGVSEGDIACDYELTSLSPETSARYASSAVNGSYGFFKKTNSVFSLGQSSLQENCYYYLNRYFDDVHVNATDLDWFICEMLGLSSYEHPSWAVDYEGNTLEKVYSVTTGSGSYTYP